MSIASAIYTPSSQPVRLHAFDKVLPFVPAITVPNR